jgi:hypothetical protein
MAIACREDAERIAARQVHFADENRTHELVVAIVEERLGGRARDDAGDGFETDRVAIEAADGAGRSSRRQ